MEEFHKHLQHIDTRLGVQVERMRELNAQEALLGAPLSSVAAISRTQMFLEPFLRLWEVHEVGPSGEARGGTRVNRGELVGGGGGRGDACICRKRALRMADLCGTTAVAPPPPHSA